MNYLKLSNGTDMPILGFGTFMLSGAECESAVKNALAAGYRMIDTAQAYGNEEAVGNAIKNSSVLRENIFLVTKVDFKSYKNADDAINESLKKLKTDYIDLILLHWPFADYYAAWRALENAYADGKVRSIGVSNFDSARLIDLIKYNDISPTVNQIETNLYCSREGEKPWLKRNEVAHMAYAPLGQGNRGEMFCEPAVIAAAENHGKTEAQILLRYLIQQNIAVIPRSRSAEHIKENSDIFDFSLTDREMSELAKASKNIPLIGNPNSPELVTKSFNW